MSTSLDSLERVEELSVKLLADHLITFEEFLNLDTGDELYELIDGSLVKQMAASLEHESLFAWLLVTLTIIADRLDLGLVRGSRTAIPIHELRGRLPDILFVKRERMPAGSGSSTALGVVPDLVIEIVSPGDSRADIMSREMDCTSIGVCEILFFDVARARIRAVRNLDGQYIVEEFSDGTLSIESMGGISLPVAWISEQARPKPEVAANSIC